MALINLYSIFNDSTVQSFIPPYFDNTEPPIISYTYTKPSQSLIFNHTSVTSNVIVEKKYSSNWRL